MTKEMSPRTIAALEEIDARLGVEVCSRLSSALVEPASFAGACFDFLSISGSKDFSALDLARFLKQRKLHNCARIFISWMLIEKPRAVARYLS